ncbi:MAG: class I tRNA ligase family protein, partial [Candidatus Peregrinibacteria bacterium]|nr:class I tRNA ligase family protein [Candidatus Peregrinibacteria bacterium]
ADSPLVVHPDAEYVKVRISNAEGRMSDETFIIVKNLLEDKERLGKVFNLLGKDLKFEVLETFKGLDLAGQKFEYETYAGKRKFYVVADNVIDPEKGTGAMTISSNHSTDDYDLAQRLKLDETFIEKIDFDGKMTAIAGSCQGMSVKDARKKSAEIMQEKGLLVGIDKEYVHRVPLCYRSGCVVEPMISPQWFVSVEKEFTDKWTGQTTTLKKLTQDAVREKHVKIIPERFEKIYFQWIDNLRDWCISRQIWWGHRIPVWYDEKGEIHLPIERKIVFARHGESEGNAQNIVQGTEGDYALTEKGRNQAEELAVKVAASGEKFTKVVCSDLRRAHETGQIVAERLGIKNVETWSEIREMSFGDLDGKDKQEVFGKEEIYVEDELPLIFDDNIGDKFEDMIQKRLQFLEKIKEEEGNVLVVSHETVLGTIFATHKFGERLSREEFEIFAKAWQVGNGETRQINDYVAPKVESGQKLKQDEDTLDTWFSSALWPFSTVGWPDENSDDFKKFYANDVLETGHDILFFWVARMIMFGRYATGKYPFHTAYLHGLVCDEHGKKMSKSKGNGIDPLDVISEFGADPVRLALVIGSAPGQNIPIGSEKISGYRNFVNKLWNAGRFVQMNLGASPKVQKSKSQKVLKENYEFKPESLAEKWILSRFGKVSKEIGDNLAKYNISAAGDKTYHFVWGEFCDWFIEASKVSPNPEFLKSLYGEILKLVHPLCPFVTEEIWKELFDSEELILEQDFPKVDFEDSDSEVAFEKIKALVTEIRSLRADEKVNPKEKLLVEISGDLDDEVLKLIEVLAGVKFQDVEKEQSSKIVVQDLEIFVQIPVDENRVKAEIEGLKKEIAALEGRLSNKSYVERAPEKLVNETKEKLEMAKEKLEKLT